MDLGRTYCQARKSACELCPLRARCVAFKEGRSLIWKSLRVTRVFDAENNALIYLAHAREIQQGSGKMSLSVVPLNTEQVTWSNGAPAQP